MFSPQFIFAVLILLFLSSSISVARDVEVLVESRKGIGLIPASWRGIRHGTDTLPLEGLSWVRIDPSLVVTAWREKIGGGGPGWVALERTIDSVRSQGARVFLPLPTAAAPKSQETWCKRIEDTVRRTAERVDRFEILADPTQSVDRYLDLYEAGVWAAYQGYHKASVGGPGAALGTHVLSPLIRRCSDRNLPLSFVSWRVKAQTGEEAEDSFSRVEVLLDRIDFRERPAAIVSGWAMDDRPDAPAVTLSFLYGLTKANLEASFAELEGLTWGLAAMQAYEHLGPVEIPIMFDPKDELSGVATLQEDDVRILLWAKRMSTANIFVSGMRWGRTYEYVRSVVGLRRTQVVETLELRAEDPLLLEVSVSPGSPVFLTLTPRN